MANAASVLSAAAVTAASVLRVPSVPRQQSAHPSLPRRTPSFSTAAKTSTTKVSTVMTRVSMKLRQPPISRRKAQPHRLEPVPTASVAVAAVAVVVQLEPPVLVLSLRAAAPPNSPPTQPVKPRLQRGFTV